MPAPALLPAIFAGASAVATGVGAYGQYRASKQAAAVDQSVANYNANVDRDQAKQLDVNTLRTLDLKDLQTKSTFPVKQPRMLMLVY